MLCLPGCDSPGSRIVRLEGSPGNLSRTVLDGQSRYVLRGHDHRFPLNVPPGGSLEVHLGVNRESLAADRAPLEARVSFEANGVSRVLLRRTVGQGQQLRESQWYDFNLPLLGLEGQSGSLSLAVAALDGSEAPENAVAWANPMLVPAKGRADTSFILISIDTLRADRLGCYGHDRDTSPNIDRMAREGVLFARAMSTSSWTLPAHASMFTGLEPHRHGAVAPDQKLDGDLETLAEALWDEAFETAAFTGGGFVDAWLGFAQGFEVYWSPSSSFADRLPFNSERATRWMGERLGRPFFVFLHTYQVHTPFAPPPPFDRLFDPDYNGPHRGHIKLEDVRLLGRDARLLHHALALYDGLVRHVDQEVGDLLDFLESSGLSRNTCVIFTSDHGEEFFEHGDFGHARAKLYSELIHVPLIFWCPSRFSGGRVVDEVVSLVDIMPTVLEMAGIPPPEGIQGRSLVSALSGRSDGRERVVLSETVGHTEKPPGFAVALTGDRYRVIESRLREQKRQLFDLRADPGEQSDLSSTQPGLFELFQPTLEEALTARSDPVATRNTEPAAVDASLRERLRALGYDP